MFSFLSDLFRREESLPLESAQEPSEKKALTYADHQFLVLGPETAAGVSVSPETALRCAVVYACVKIISESVAQLPLHLYRRNEDDSKERARDHPLYRLLHDQPNEWTTAFEFRVDMTADLLRYGEAFAFINRNTDGEIVELIQIPTPSVTVERNALTMEPSYRVTLGDGRQVNYRRDQILHLRSMLGLSPVMQAREAIALSLAQEKHAAKLFGNGARPSGVLKHSGRLGEGSAERLRASWQGAHGGGENSGRTAILEEGMDFQALTFNSVDLQFLELRRHQVAEIARVFRVPLSLINDLERVTHANAESLGRQFLSFTLLPWLQLWEQAIARSLLTPEEQGEYFAEFLTDEFARADLAARFEAYAKAVTNGLLNPNEVRAAENRSPYEGGDEFRLPMNTEPPNANA